MDLFNLDRAYARSRSTRRTTEVAGDMVSRNVIPADLTRIALRVWAEPLNTSAGVCWLRDGTQDKDDNDSLGLGVRLCQITNAQTPGAINSLSPNGAGVISVGVGGAVMKFATANGGPRTQGNIDPTTGDVDTQTHMTENGHDYTISGNAIESAAELELDLPTFTVTGQPSVLATNINQLDFKMTLRDDGDLVRAAWNCVCFNNQFTLHICEVFAEECCVQEWSTNPYAPNVHPKK